MPNQEPAFAWPFGNCPVRVGTQGLFHLCLKTFVAPFLQARLTAPGSPRMAISWKMQLQSLGHCSLWFFRFPCCQKSRINWQFALLWLERFGGLKSCATIYDTSFCHYFHISKTFYETVSQSPLPMPYISVHETAKSDLTKKNGEFFFHCLFCSTCYSPPLTSYLT